MVPPFMPSEMTKVSYNGDTRLKSYEDDTELLIDCSFENADAWPIVYPVVATTTNTSESTSEKPFC